MKIEGGVSLKTILRNLRHGFRTLTCMNWVSGSGFHVASLLGAVGRWLQNPGNNCFLNVILQVWLLRVYGFLLFCLNLVIW
jgi:hypothetical protein